ncbi:MAG: Uma2 family endonuclease [Bacteroidota bacterium]
MNAEKLIKLSYEGYVQLEEETQIKHEFHDGTIVVVAGGTVEHGLIAGNVFSELGIALRAEEKGCRPINSDVKLHIEASNKYLYPDGMVICGDIERSENSDAVINPIVIIEVLSKSTETYDRGDKFFFYRQIPGFQDYILIDQYQARVEIFSRVSGLWKIVRVEGIDNSFSIPSLDLELSLSTIYQDVTFLDVQ